MHSTECPSSFLCDNFVDSFGFVDENFIPNTGIEVAWFVLRKAYAETREQIWGMFKAT